MYIMSNYKYICNVCNLTFDNEENAGIHITMVKHKKKTEENVLKDSKLTEEKKEELENFSDHQLVSEKDGYYSKLLKVDLETNARKYTYFCKFCKRQFVKKGSLMNHMNNTCKVKRQRSE